MLAQQIKSGQVHVATSASHYMMSASQVDQKLIRNKLDSLQVNHILLEKRIKSCEAQKGLAFNLEVESIIDNTLRNKINEAKQELKSVLIDEKKKISQYITHALNENFKTVIIKRGEDIEKKTKDILNEFGVEMSKQKMQLTDLLDSSIHNIFNLPTIEQKLKDKIRKIIFDEDIRKALHLVINQKVQKPFAFSESYCRININERQQQIYKNMEKCIKNKEEMNPQIQKMVEIKIRQGYSSKCIIETLNFLTFIWHKKKEKLTSSSILAFIFEEMTKRGKFYRTYKLNQKFPYIKQKQYSNEEKKTLNYLDQYQKDRKFLSIYEIVQQFLRYEKLNFMQHKMFHQCIEACCYAAILLPPKDYNKKFLKEPLAAMIVASFDRTVQHQANNQQFARAAFEENIILGLHLNRQQFSHFYDYFKSQISMATIISTGSPRKISLQ